MKYYLLMALSLPILSFQSSELFQRQLTREEIDIIVLTVPKINKDNLTKEVEKLNGFIKESKEQLTLVYQTTNAQTKLLKLIDKKKNRNEYIELELKISKNSFLAARLLAYHKNVQMITKCVEESLAEISREQDRNDKIKLLVDRIAGAKEAEPFDTEKKLEEFYASLQ